MRLCGTLPLGSEADEISAHHLCAFWMAGENNQLPVQSERTQGRGGGFLSSGVHFREGVIEHQKAVSVSKEKGSHGKPQRKG